MDYLIVKNNDDWHYLTVNNNNNNDNDNNWHYLPVKNINRLLRGIASNHNGDFYCLNCCHSYTTKKKFKKHERICRDHDFCYVKMPDENKKMLKYNPGEKSLKRPFIICADLECLLEKISAYQNNAKKILYRKES